MSNNLVQFLRAETARLLGGSEDDARKAHDAYVALGANEWEALKAYDDARRGWVDPDPKVIVGDKWVSLDPKPEEIDIRAVVETVCGIRRWNGRFGNWTVGKHTLALYEIARDSNESTAIQLALLLHDLHEAFTGDITGPVKRANPILRQCLTALENTIDAAIRAHLGLGAFSLLTIERAKEYDAAICRYEASMFGAPAIRARVFERHADVNAAMGDHYQSTLAIMRGVNSLGADDVRTLIVKEIERLTHPQEAP